MKIAVIGDAHLGCSDYTDKRASDYANKFVEAIQLALQNDAKIIVLLGDIFDSSAYRRNVDAFASILHDIAPSLIQTKSRDVPVVCILGNHEFGRGRQGGEIGILSDLGFVHLLNDNSITVKGIKFCGISWKSQINQFESTLERLSGEKRNSYLLIHQFVSGGHQIPTQIAEIDKRKLEGWKKVFVGHHHIHESFDNICIPGSLEIHNVLEIRRGLRKGFVIYDTESGMEEFIELKPSRPIKYINIDVGGSKVLEVQNLVKRWILHNAEPHALLIVRITGKLKSGRSSEINLRDCRAIGFKKGCLEVSIINSIEDTVRTAADIRSTMNIERFLEETFKKSEREKAVTYFEKFKEIGDEYATEIKDTLIEELS
jgi:DNA repair exonuclease SbcCD nuclease subunit